MENVNKQDLFRQYLAENNFQCAWLTLVSRGWNLGQVSVAMKELSAAAEDLQFEKFAKAWCELPHYTFVKY